MSSFNLKYPNLTHRHLMVRPNGSPTPFQNQLFRISATDNRKLKTTRGSTQNNIFVLNTNATTFIDNWDKAYGQKRKNKIQTGSNDSLKVVHIVNKDELIALLPFTYLEQKNNADLYHQPGFNFDQFVREISAEFGEYIEFESELQIKSTSSDFQYQLINSRPLTFALNPTVEELLKGFTIIRKAVFPDKFGYTIDFYEDNHTAKLYLKWNLYYQGEAVHNPVQPFEQEESELVADAIPYARNLLLYGAPGTGKSYEIEERSRMFGSRKNRVTFYPDYTYNKFIGSYKPSAYYRLNEQAAYYLSKEGKVSAEHIKSEPVIDYAFIPGPFTQALMEAYLSPEPYLLIIEEINRANAAAVFGEIFQLLDREDGKSQYKVTLVEEAMAYIRSKLGDKAPIIERGIFIPSNLYLWATMNSADQGVFHMDAAFKRRWHFEYLPLNQGEAATAAYEIICCKKKYSWNAFRKKINEFLIENKVAEDRLLGPFFMSQSELGDEEAVKNKLLVYLRDDVLRHNPRLLFKHSTFSEIIEQYENGDIFQETMAKKLTDIALPPEIIADEADQ